LQTPLNQILDFVSGHGFNAIRLPFSLAMALDLNRKNDKWIVDDGTPVVISSSSIVVIMMNSITMIVIIIIIIFMVNSIRI
jgi:hypothetical protein